MMREQPRCCNCQEPCKGLACEACRKLPEVQKAIAPFQVTGDDVKAALRFALGIRRDYGAGTGDLDDAQIGELM